MNIERIVDRYLKCKSNNMNLLEENTKNAFINPFLKELGYDMEDIFVITSEFNTYKNDAVDYAILKDGEAFIFLEAKKMNEKLDSHKGQLRKYFNMTVSAKFGILTNGIDYEIYTDTQDKNVMDDKPIMSFSLTNPNMEIINKFYEIFNLNNLHNVSDNVEEYLNEVALEKVFNNHITAISKEFLEFINSVTDRNISKSDIQYFFNKLERDTNKEDVEDKEDVEEEIIDTLIHLKDEDTCSSAIKAGVECEEEVLVETIEANNKPEQIYFLGESREEALNSADVIYYVKNEKLESLVIQGLCYKNTSFSDAYYQLVQYIMSNYKIDLSKILTSSAYYKEYKQLPSYLLSNKRYKQLNNKGYLSLNLSASEFIKNSIKLCNSVNLSFEKIDID